MLPPYPNNNTRYHHHHHWVSYQEPQPPSITAFLMSAASSSSSLDECDAQARFFFPSADAAYGGAQVETLEAVLRQRVTAAPAGGHAAPAEGGSEGRSSVSVAVAAPPPPPQQPRRRPFRTDRHSKIRTAQGVRDRRMRLSVGVARDFFALQDRLGFDKASKTVDWLLTQSKSAIDRLNLSDTDTAAAGDAVAAPPPRDPSAASAALAKAKGEAAATSSSTTESKSSARARESTTEKQARSRGDGSSASLVALVDELAWTVSPAATTTMEQPMDGLEYYYQYYSHLEEMMSCEPSTTED